jgi:hypothetical protein
MTDQDRFSEADHERARRLGDIAMGRQPATTAPRAKRSKTARFPYLSVEVRDGQVYRVGVLTKLLGPLAGAHAEITAPSRRRNVGTAAVTLMPLIALSKRDTAAAFVVIADGTVHQQKLDGNGPVRKAQAEVVKFNALAAAAGGES